MALRRIHLRKGKGRTTVSLERVLAELLSIHLCGKLDSSTVSAWCQREVEKDPGAFAQGASQRLASLAALEIAPKMLQEAYWNERLKAGKAKILAKRVRPSRRARA
jgi:hypothetical protein